MNFYLVVERTEYTTTNPQPQEGLFCYQQRVTNKQALIKCSQRLR